MIRFHLDENVNHAIATGLRSRGVDVATSTDAQLVAASDVDQLSFAFGQDRVLFTHDTDFLHSVISSSEHAGIVFSPKGRRTIGEVVRHLALMADVLDEDEIHGRIEYL